MGLLGDMNDPSTLATLQLAGGLLSPGSLGQGMQRGLTGYQSALMNAQDMAAKKQAMDIQNIQLQQQKRMFDLQTPFMEAAVREMQRQQQQGPSAATAAMGLGAQNGSIGPTVDNAQRMDAMPAAEPFQPRSMAPGVPSDVLNSTIGFGGFSKIPELISKYNEPTEFGKTLVAAGIDPQSAQGRALLRANIEKTNNIPLQAGRAGAPMYNSRGEIVAMAPKIPDNFIPTIENGRVVGGRQLPGGIETEQDNAAALALGKGEATPFAGVDRNGNPLQLTSVTAALGRSRVNAAPSAAPQSEVVAPTRSDANSGASFQTQDAAGMRKSLNSIKDPMERAAMLAAFDRQFPQEKPASGGIYAAPPLGAATGAEFQQTDLGKRYSALRDSAAQAQTTNSYLENIKQLSSTASTGQFSDKQKFINSLLSMAGKETATSAVTANNLLDKYGNQIVARLGQGGLGTDSARAILQSAYPNAHMTPAAINEAADNLIGANEMTKAKMSLLAPHGNAKDPVAYQQKEQVFDQAADPRLWQLKAMTPEHARTFLQAMPPAVRADLQQRAKTLQGLGAL